MGMHMIKIQCIMGRTKQSEKRHNVNQSRQLPATAPRNQAPFSLNSTRGSLNSNWGPWVLVLTWPAVFLHNVFLCHLYYTSLNEVFVLLWSMCSPLISNKMPRTGNTWLSLWQSHTSKYARTNGVCYPNQEPSGGPCHDNHSSELCWKPKETEASIKLTREPGPGKQRDESYFCFKCCLSSWSTEAWRVPVVHYFAGQFQFSRRVTVSYLLSQASLTFLFFLEYLPSGCLPKLFHRCNSFSSLLSFWEFFLCTWHFLLRSEQETQLLLTWYRVIQNPVLWST